MIKINGHGKGLHKIKKSETIRLLNELFKYLDRLQLIKVMRFAIQLKKDEKNN